MKIIWVGPEGNDTTGNGSKDLSYATIERALLDFDSGDQIRLKDGVYTPVDSIVIQRKDGSIFSENPLGATIQPQRTTSHAACLAVENTNRFVLCGVNVIQADETTGNLYGIYVNDVDNFVAYTCAVSDFAVPSSVSCGIVAIGQNGVVENCLVEDIRSEGGILYGIATSGHVEVRECAVKTLSSINICDLYAVSIGNVRGINMPNWNTPVDSNIIPLVTCTYDLGSPTKMFRNGYFNGKLTVQGGIDPTYLQLTATTSASVPDNSFFLNAVDGKLYFKFSGGSIVEIGTQSTPGVYAADTITNFPAGLPSGSTDQITISAPSLGNAPSEGLVMNVELINFSLIASGDTRVKIYNDAARGELIFDRIFNMADTPLVDTLPCHFKSDNGSAMYVDITNSTGSTGRFQLSIRTASVMPAATPPAGSGSGVNADVVGNGLQYSGGRITFRKETNSGLQYTGAAPTQKIRVGAGSGISVSGDLVAVDSTVLRSTTDQSAAGVKRFTDSAFGLTPSATLGGGPPAGGTPAGGNWAVGDLYMDINQVLWMCVSAGSPGDWKLFGWDYSQGIDVDLIAAVDNSNYTGEIAAGSYEDVAITVTGNRGMIRKLNVWATDPAGGDDWPATDLDQPYRVSCYANHTRYGREQIWSVLGQARKTYMTAGKTGGVDTSIEANDVSLASQDDLLRLRDKASPGEEYARVTSRSTTALTFSFDIEIINTFLLNDPIMMVTEFVELPFINDSTITPQTIFLRFYNDGATPVKFGYQLDVESMGGGTTL